MRKLDMNVTLPNPPPVEDWDYRFCTCDQYAWSEEPCPFVDDVFGEVKLCNCCPSCRGVCSDDI